MVKKESLPKGPTYVVRPNGTLSGIAKRTLGSPDRWQEIARAKNMGNGSDLIFVGQHLVMPSPVQQQQIPMATIMTSAKLSAPIQDRPATIFLGHAHLFIIADEVSPLTRRVVRKVLLPPKGITNAADIARLTHPEQYGFQPRSQASNVGLGRHVGGRTDSRYISASDRALGSSRLQGNRFFINVDKARASGVKVHETSEIISDLDSLIAKTRQADRQARLRWIRDKALNVDNEVLLEGAVPAAAVKTTGMMAATRGVQVLFGVRVVLTAYDLEQAGQRSYQQGSVRPLAAETVRQAGGWAGAWAGMEIAGGVGAAVGVETGPGALVTGLIGGLVGGYAGFTGADWASRWIEH